MFPLYWVGTLAPTPKLLDLLRFGSLGNIEILRMPSGFPPKNERGYSRDTAGGNGVRLYQSCSRGKKRPRTGMKGGRGK